MDTITLPNINVRGSAKFGSVSLPDNCVGDNQVSASDPLGASKLYHRHEKTITQSGTATTATHFLGPRPVGGTVTLAASSLTVAVGAATVGIVLKKNGSSIMSSALTLDTSNTIGVEEDGSLTAGAAYSADDYFAVEITATASGGTLPTGLNVRVTFEEAPA